MNTQNQRRQKKLYTQLIVGIIIATFACPIYSEDDPVFSNKNDDSGINHLFDKGNGTVLFVTPEKGSKSAQGPKPIIERQKIVVKTRKKEEVEKSKLIRSKRTFGRMALKVKAKDIKKEERKRTFAAFGEKFKKN